MGPLSSGLSARSHKCFSRHPWELQVSRCCLHVPLRHGNIKADPRPTTLASGPAIWTELHIMLRLQCPASIALQMRINLPSGSRLFSSSIPLQGHACSSLQFGAWAGAGMAGGALASRLECSGLLLVTPPFGLTALGGWSMPLPVPSGSMLHRAYTGGCLNWKCSVPQPRHEHQPALATGTPMLLSLLVS